MINVKELRIGNCVSYLGNNTRTNNISVGDNGGYVSTFKSGIITQNQIEPIPLTEELLLKCGFKKTGDYAFEYKDDADLIFDAPNDWENTGDYPVGITSIDPGYPAMYIPHGEVIIRCLYLHDLQNKFFAITGKELEVDL